MSLYFMMLMYTRFLLLFMVMAILSACDGRKDSGQYQPPSQSNQHESAHESRKPVQLSPNAKGDERLSAQEKISIIADILNKLHQVKEQIQASPHSEVFLDSITKTITLLEQHKTRLEGSGMPVSIKLLIDTEIKPSDKVWIIINSAKYWEDFRTSLLGYGYLQSSNLSDFSHLGLFAKSFYKSALPDDAYIITSGEYKGFLLIRGGDLIVPGIAFYQEVLTHNDLSTYKTIRSHYITQYKAAAQHLEQGSYEVGIKELSKLLKSPFTSRQTRGLIHYDLGRLYFMKKDYEQMITHLEKSVEIGTPIPGVYSSLASIYESQDSSDKADRVRKKWTNIANAEDQNQKLPKLIIEGVKTR